jgi:hypothetical protein
MIYSTRLENKRIKFNMIYTERRRDMPVHVVTRLQAGSTRNLGSVPGRVKIFFSSPQHLDWLWGSSSLLSS